MSFLSVNIIKFLFARMREGLLLWNHPLVRNEEAAYGGKAAALRIF